MATKKKKNNNSTKNNNTKNKSVKSQTAKKKNQKTKQVLENKIQEDVAEENDEVVIEEEKTPEEVLNEAEKELEEDLNAKAHVDSQSETINDLVATNTIAFNFSEEVTQSFKKLNDELLTQEIENTKYNSTDTFSADFIYRVFGAFKHTDESDFYRRADEQFSSLFGNNDNANSSFTQELYDEITNGETIDAEGNIIAKPKKKRKPLTKEQKIKYFVISTIILVVVGVSYVMFAYSSITYHDVKIANNPNPTSYRMIDGAVSFTELDQEGYEFEGWYTDSSYEHRIKGISSGSFGHVDVYAKWTIIDYRLDYDLDGGTLYNNNPYTYNVESTITLYSPQKTGYVFNGWRDSYGNYVSFIYPGTTGDKYLTAQWDEQRYYITYSTYYQVSNPNESSFTINDNFELEDLEKKGYEFLGWYKNGGSEKVESTEGYTEDLKLTAKWELATYKVSYDLNGGTCSSSLKSSYTINNTFSLPSTCTRKGYTFDGWYNQHGDYMTSVYSYSENLKIEARWNPITYYLNYSNTKGAYNPNPSSYTADDGNMELYDLEDEGNYVFDGWEYKGSIVSSINAAEAGDATLTARWSTRPVESDY